MYDLPRRYFACINGEYYIYSVSRLGEKGILLKTRKNPLENAEIIEDDDISIVLIDEKDERISDIFTGRIDFIYNEPEMGEEGYSYHYNLGDNSIGAECTTLYGTSAWAGWEQIGKYDFVKEVPISDFRDVIYERKYVKKDGILLDEVLVEKQEISYKDIKAILDSFWGL